MASKFAYVTLLTNTSYLPGLLVLEWTLRAVDSRYPLVVMVTPQLPPEARDILTRSGIAMRDVQSLHPSEGLHSLAVHDARFADTWTKLRGFDLMEYDRIVLMDADMIVVRNMDELMDIDLPRDWIAATHVCACNPHKLSHYPVDWIPENCAYTPLVHPSAVASPTPVTESSPRPHSQLNSGVVVLHPSCESSAAIARHLTLPVVSSFSFPDQDLLSDVFKGRWKPLPWCYNALKTLSVIHEPIWRDDEIRCLHYIFAVKPWHNRIKGGGEGEPYERLHAWWWENFEKLGREMQVRDPEGWQIVLQNVAQE